MDTNFLKAHADRCRSLAENADEFTKRRLLDLAANYDKRLRAAGASPSARMLKAPLDLKDAPTQSERLFSGGRSPAPSVAPRLQGER
jgi:hypothetical protein